MEPDEDWPGARDLTPVVNGTPMTELVGSFEATRGYEPAGGYAGIVLGPSGDPAYARDLTEHRRFRRARRVAVLGCECGETGCWPLEAAVHVNKTTVTWTEFRQPHRPQWSYAGFGPFVFDASTYRAAVSEALQR